MSYVTFLGIGAQKAGTTWLHHHLSRHPEVWLPPIKELHFFSHLFCPTIRTWTADHIKRKADEAIRWWSQNSPGMLDFDQIRYLCRLTDSDMFTESWYRAAMSYPGTVHLKKGEICPGYSLVGQAGISYIRSLLGAVKIIYIIRDPAERVQSQIRMAIDSGRQLSHEEMIDLASSPDFSNRSAYSRIVPLWKSAFASRDLLFLPYGEIARNPENLMRRVEEFLGLSPTEYSSLNERVHASRHNEELPPEVLARIASRYSAEQDFIAQEFGREFAENIR